MNRRNFNLLAGGSMFAIAGVGGRAFGQAGGSAALLETTLTPLGAERAGNAAGTIPAWTGGFSEVPSSWNPATQMLPDFFADDPILYTVDSSNMAQYADLLSEAVQVQIQKYGMKLNVYKTRRTACAPQYVYDNTASNVATAQLAPGGGRLGFSGAYGGTPFPIPNTSVPLDAGAQIMWNHVQRWNGVGYTLQSVDYSISNGQKTISGASIDHYYFPYYEPKGSLATFNGINQQTHENLTGPATIVGEEIVTRYYTNSLVHPNITWETLQGQGRVRKAPEIQYDTPASTQDDICNYDEFNGFSGDLHQYDWNYVKKQEMLIPYNCNKLRHADPEQVIGAYFIDPSVIRWELHRVWVVEATVHPGMRNTLARRRVYFDEDSWMVALSDCYDANNKIYHLDVNYFVAMPNMPGVFPLFNLTYNVQTGDWTQLTAVWGTPPCNVPIVFGAFASGEFDPQSMAAAASY